MKNNEVDLVTDKDLILKHFFRFLKEQGCFKRCIDIYLRIDKTIGSRRNKPIKDILAFPKPKGWISSSSTFCLWSNTPEGDKFWWAISLLWQGECTKNLFDTWGDLELDKTLLRKNVDAYFDYCKKAFPRTSVDEQIILAKHTELKKLKNEI